MNSSLTKVEADREPVALGQHNVENYCVVLAIAGRFKAADAVVALIDEVASVTELIGHRLRQGFVVFNN